MRRQLHQADTLQTQKWKVSRQEMSHMAVVETFPSPRSPRYLVHPPQKCVKELPRGVLTAANPRKLCTQSLHQQWNSFLVGHRGQNAAVITDSSGKSGDISLKSG